MARKRKRKSSAAPRRQTKIEELAGQIAAVREQIALNTTKEVELQRRLNALNGTQTQLHQLLQRLHRDMDKQIQ